MGRYSRTDALDMILVERRQQTSRWTVEHDNAHTNAEWCMLLNIYVGKLNDIVLNGDARDENVRREIIECLSQVGALTVAALEHQDVL